MSARATTSSLAQHPRRGAGFALALALVSGLVATPAHPIELIVAAASSLREPLTEISRRFERRHADLRVRTAFGASNVLAAPARAVRRIAIPEHSVPVGRYAREWLAGHALLDAVAPRTIRTEHARATLIAVDRGLADAAIIYTTDARLARVATVAFEIPSGEQPRIVYVAASLADTREPTLSSAFLEFLTTQGSASILEDAGFGPPPGDAVDPVR